MSHLKTDRLVSREMYDQVREERDRLRAALDASNHEPRACGCVKVGITARACDRCRELEQARVERDYAKRALERARSDILALKSQLRFARLR